MIKIIYEISPGRIEKDEFEDANEFIRLELDDFPPFDDNWKILELEIDGEEQEFTGTILDLYNLLWKL